MEELIRKRGRTKGKLTRIAAFGEHCKSSEVSPMDIKLRLEMLPEIWSEFDSLQSKIECDYHDVDLEVQQLEQEEFETKFLATKARLMSIHEQITPLTIQQGMRSNEVKTQVKLPAIELPVFTGDYKLWTSFSDLFQSLIHTNAALSPVQKLHYLKSSIKGEAARLLSSLTVTDANYLEAWKILSDRYANKRRVVQAHLKALHTQPKLSSETVKDIRNLMDVTVENVRALHALDLPTEHWDCLLIYLVTDRLDSNTRRQWELSLGDQDDPLFEDLKDFIEKHCRAVEASTPDRGTSLRTKVVQGYRQSTISSSYHMSTVNCIKCNGQHPLYRCEQFHRLPVEERIELVRSSALCFNCMKGNHVAKECQSSLCRKCNLHHNTLLHREIEQKTDNSDTTVNSYHIRNQPINTQVLLATAIVQIHDSFGNTQRARALLDSGSQATFISEDCVQRLGLQRRKANVTIGGLGATGVGTCRGMVELNIISMHSSYKCRVQALILHRVTGIIPHQPVDTSRLTAIVHHHQLNLADPDYHQPGSIDILLGADIYYELLLSGKIKEDNSQSICQNTNLGWVITGLAPSCSSLMNVVSLVAFHELDNQLKNFWEMEEINHIKKWTAEEELCEEHFRNTYTRNETGRFVVKLPFRDNLPEVGDSGLLAQHRLLQMEKRLEFKPVSKQGYCDFMSEYLDLGHMEVVSFKDQKFNCYYLPHHYVIKESSMTTKLRVVFDGTAQPAYGISLNSALMVGPTIQQDLLDIVMRFRMYNFVLTADIAKMYRQVLVHPDHCDYQRIKWRSSPMETIHNYRLKTVTYGTASAPFLAIRCLHELAAIGESSYSKASTVMRRDFYVDDLLTGANTIHDAQEIQLQLIELLSSAGFELRKWSSNSQLLIEKLPRHLHSSEPVMGITGDSVKTLGILWQPENDQFSFKVTKDSLDIITKRKVLSQISKLYDPLGWLSPVIVRAKMLIQRLWLLGIDWDKALPLDLASEWKRLYDELELLEQISIPRQMIDDSSTGDYQLHGFCDASESAFGAMIFIRSVSSYQITVRLVCSKTRVAPLKRISVPHLELCGALMLARLMKRVMSTLNIQLVQSHAWTDSTVVLSWLQKPSYCWKTFVANRVTETQELVPPSCWGHVSTTDNPADFLSRGLSPGQLINNALWWSGPSWLAEEESFWPHHDLTNDTSALSELRKPKVQAYVAVRHAPMVVSDYSSLTRLIRVTAYCRRFIKNCKTPKEERTGGYLVSNELRDGLHFWIARAQAESFSQEIHNCLDNKPVPSKSKLISLSPFVDGLGLLRVGGRLQHSIIPYDQKHPLILPQGHALTHLIIKQAHIANLHAGLQLLQTILLRSYWIIRAKQTIKQLLHKCIQCFRHRVVTSQQLMGSLPQTRVEPMRAFMRCGIDYAGPILLKLAKGRGNGRTHKAYICIFVCFSTKAIHIELVNDLTTDSFLAALRRFVSRRGKPSDIYSDCGTNFVGADHRLRELQHLITSSKHKSEITSVLSNDGIDWHFSPPSSPHFGGLWEAGVKSIKFHLRRVIGTVSLTYEEMYTVLTQIEACLNSRPLCPISSNPSDLGILTPGHFLIGEALTAFPDRDVTELKINRLSRWELVQRLSQHFWKRWSSEYLSRLQQRPKWMIPKANINVGDLVLMKDNCSPLHWPMARVLEIHPGDDGLVRVVTVRTATGIFKRSISKCCILPIEKLELPIT